MPFAFSQSGAYVRCLIVTVTNDLGELSFVVLTKFAGGIDRNISDRHRYEPLLQNIDKCEE